MARVAKGMMSDRREDVTTANVKCYIYNSKTNVPEPTSVTPDVSVKTPTPVVQAEPVVSMPIISIPVVKADLVAPVVHPVAPTVKPRPVMITPIVVPTVPVAKTEPIKSEPVITEPTPVVIPTPVVSAPVVTTPVVIPAISPTPITKTLELVLDNLSDIAQHFITQNDIILTQLSTATLTLGEVATLTFEIKDKKSGELYSGLLPFSFTILSTDDSLQPDISTIELINN